MLHIEWPQKPPNCGHVFFDLRRSFLIFFEALNNTCQNFMDFGVLAGERVIHLTLVEGKYVRWRTSLRRVLVLGPPDLGLRSVWLLLFASRTATDDENENHREE